MTRLRRVSPAALTIFAVLAGCAAVLAGVYLLAGLAVTLIVGGLALVALGFLADVD